MERNTGLTIETLALFVRFWLAVTPTLQEEDQASAQVKGRKRYDGLIETLGRGSASGRTLLDEIPEDVWPRSSSGHSDHDDSERYWFTPRKSRPLALVRHYF
ncbi:hypothetical protein GCM10023208_30300 [Erythrobacter westpacificensis]|uniref:Uncharacterized protein n=1 Tax=Erythrobacter westpacificensis TaxID=1055231 RepID=A0ABP9KP37_9SPHN